MMAILGRWVIAAALLAPAAPAAATLPEPIDFAVYRDGAEIGHHRVRFDGAGDVLEVDIDIRLEVGLGFITLYRYDHRNSEVWRDGAFVGFTSRTDDNGDWDVTRAEVLGDTMVVDGPEAAPGPIAPAAPTTYWNRDWTVGARAMVDTQTGRLLAVAVAPVGRETVATADGPVQAERYRMSGDLELDIWYDDAGRWVKLAFELGGADFEYVLR